MTTTPRARILVTIGAVWAAVIVITSIALLGAKTSDERYTAPQSDGFRDRYVVDLYPWSTWLTVTAIATVLAAVAVGLAIAWTGRDS